MLWMKGCTMKRTAFTLVEMLLIGAIICILFSLLLPALQSSVSSARGVACTGNLRQLALTFSSYTEDNRGMLPKDANTRVKWQYSLRPELGEEYRSLLSKEMIFWCPHDPDTLTGLTTNTAFGNGWLSYGFNFFYLTGTRINSIKKPADTVCTVESAANPGYASPCRGFFWVNPWRDGANPMAYPRHDSAANVLWADGHASYVLAADGTYSSLYDDQALGTRWSDGVDGGGPHNKWDCR